VAAAEQGIDYDALAVRSASDEFVSEDEWRIAASAVTQET
jgi:hypothetical protein